MLSLTWLEYYQICHARSCYRQTKLQISIISGKMNAKVLLWKDMLFVKILWHLQPSSICLETPPPPLHTIDADWYLSNPQVSITRNHAGANLASAPHIHRHALTRQISVTGFQTAQQEMTRSLAVSVLIHWAWEVGQVGEGCLKKPCPFGNSESVNVPLL